MKALMPYELLDIGTDVITTSGYKGKVIKAIWTKDQFGMCICLHTVELNEKYDQGHIKFKQIKPKISTINYAAIYY